MNTKTHNFLHSLDIVSKNGNEEEKKVEKIVLKRGKKEIRESFSSFSSSLPRPRRHFMLWVDNVDAGFVSLFHKNDFHSHETGRHKRVLCFTARFA